MSRRVRAGVVGAGFIATRHATALAAMDDVEVVGVADPRLERAAALAASAGAADATVHTSADDLLAAHDLDALWLCVPPFAHGPVEWAAAQRGLPLFVEKPLAADLTTATDLAATLAASGVLVAVGYHWRYLDTVERARQLLDGAPPRLLVGTWLDKAPRVDWWPHRSRSGGQTVEQVTHLLDLARLFGGEVVAWTAMGSRSGTVPGDVQDAAVATLRHETGTLTSMTSSSVLAGGSRIALDVIAPGFAITLTERSMTVDTGDGPRTVETTVDPFAREDRAFVDAVLGRGDDVRAPYAEALETHRLAATLDAAAHGEELPAGVPNGPGALLVARG